MNQNHPLRLIIAIVLYVFSYQDTFAQVDSISPFEQVLRSTFDSVSAQPEPGLGLHIVIRNSDIIVRETNDTIPFDFVRIDTILHSALFYYQTKPKVHIIRNKVKIY